MEKILIVEDDKNIREELKIILENSNYLVDILEDFSDIEAQILKTRPDLILLDINLPNTDGFQICKDIRKSFDTPIIFVSSRNTDIDEIKALTLGGDDFISKPYNISILLARVRALLGRSKKLSQVTIEHGGIYLNLENFTLSKDSKSIGLSKSEYQILYFLFANSNRVISREELIDYLWDSSLFIDDNSLSVNINRIRQKLKDIGAENFIKTKHGVGYYI